jgi:hypothetical protein
MFKLYMKSNSKVAMEPPFDFDPFIHIWKTINASRFLTHSFLEYLKLAKMAIVHVLGNVEDEHCFSSLTFRKNKLQATLDLHLLLMVGMYNYKFYTLETFPYAITFDAWIGTYCYNDIV